MISLYLRQNFNRVLKAYVLPPSHHSRPLSKIAVTEDTVFAKRSIGKILSVFNLL